MRYPASVPRLRPTLARRNGIRLNTVLDNGGVVPSALTSTLTSSAPSFVAGGAGVTLTGTFLTVDSVPVVGYTPVPESGVTP